MGSPARSRSTQRARVESEAGEDVIGGRPELVRVPAQRRGQRVAGPTLRGAPAVGGFQGVAVEEGLGQGAAESAGQVVVARSGAPQSRGAGASPDRTGWIGAMAASASRIVAA